MFNNVSGMPDWAVPTIIMLAIWSAVWKAFALYKAGKIRQPLWFIVLFLVNTLGVLEIFYILVFSKIQKVKTSAKQVAPEQPVK